MAFLQNNRDFGFDPVEHTSDPVEIAYRTALADGLERVLSAGASTLEEVVAKLNDLSVSSRDGRRWTEETLAAELNRLAQ